MSFSSITWVRHLVFLVDGVEYTGKTSPMCDKTVTRLQVKDKMPRGVSYRDGDSGAYQ